MLPFLWRRRLLPTALLLLITPFQLLPFLLLRRRLPTALLPLITPFQLLPFLLLQLLLTTMLLFQRATLLRLLMLLQGSLPTILTTMTVHTNFLLLSGPDRLQYGLM